MSKNISRENIASFINDEFGLSKNDCNNFVNEIIEIIIKGLLRDNIVKIHNFGTFKIKQKKSRKGRNPKTKEEFIISPRGVISFIPSKNFVKKINKNINE